MFEKIASTIQESNRKLILATSVFLASSTSPAEAQQQLTLPSAGKNIAGNSKLDIPENILVEARLKHIDVASIKQIDGKWISCTSIPGLPDSCLELGAKNTKTSEPNVSVKVLTGLKNGDVLLAHRYGKAVEESMVSLAPDVVGTSTPGFGKLSRQKDGTVSFSLEAGTEARVVIKGKPDGQMIDTLPNFLKESDLLVRTKDIGIVKSYIAAHPNEDFLVIVTVPSHCPPCRQLDTVVSQFFKDPDSKEIRVKTFILEFFDFDTAKREALGNHGIFPTLLTFGRGDTQNKILPEIIGQTGGASVEDLAEPVLKHLPAKGYPKLLVRGGVMRDGLAKLFQELRH